MATKPRLCVVPCLRYQNAQVAIDWLCQAFGFSVHMKVLDDNQRVAHCQLVLPGGGMVMLSDQHEDSAYSDAVTLPEAVSGMNTQTIYAVVSDIHAHYEKAVEAGTRMLDPLSVKPYGGHGYDCYDLEGHVWSFGDYDPYQASS